MTDVDQFKAIIELAQGAGQGAFWVAMFWLGKGYLGTLAGFGFGTFVVCKISSLVKRGIDKSGFQTNIAHALNMDKPECNIDLWLIKKAKEAYDEAYPDKRYRQHQL